MKQLKPLLIAVAPNGARYGKDDHPALPITATELAKTAEDCLAAGATMIHLHVRDKNGRHSLAAEYYIKAIAAVKYAVADEMIIQVTSEAAGSYTSKEQISLMLQLMPDCLSIALREFVPSEAAVKPFKEFLQTLSAAGCLVQYILYDETDYKRYQYFLTTGVIPEKNHSLLLVLGRYTKSAPTTDIIEQYRTILTSKVPWMVCTFGVNAQQILSKAVVLGCNVRVGFENGFYLPDGSIANSNAELIAKSWQFFAQSGRPLATIKQTRVLLGQSECSI